MANVVSRQTGSFAWFGTSETVAITSVEPEKTIAQAQYPGTEAGPDPQTFLGAPAHAASPHHARVAANSATTTHCEGRQS